MTWLQVINRVKLWFINVITSSKTEKVIISGEFNGYLSFMVSTAVNWSDEQNQWGEILIEENR